ncbi:MAG TPA: hypothetical protein PLT65_00805 [Bacilli bacterium]|nr:hypothetical protein [Bacilli bacterium]
MDFSFIIKSIFISFFVLILLFAISFACSQKLVTSSNNFGVRNTTKESVNLGDLKAYDIITFSDQALILSTVENYLVNNNIDIDDVEFDIAVNDDIVTITIRTIKGLFEKESIMDNTFSYQIVKRSD